MNKYVKVMLFTVTDRLLLLNKSKYGLLEFKTDLLEVEEFNFHKLLQK